MKDSNWELVNGPAAHEIEFINHENQINMIEALVKLYTTIAPVDHNGCRACPTPRILRELHRMGTMFLLEDPGEYRKNYNVVVRKGDNVVHEPPPWEQVEQLMAEFHQELAGMWDDPNRVRAAAFALWRINWVHPFRNGNGRSARSFAYACLCLKFAAFLPGSPTVLDMIMADREPYEAALRQADLTLAETGAADLAPMEEYLATLVIKQLESA